MGENKKGFEGEMKLEGGSFSRLLLSSSSDDNVVVEEKPKLLLSVYNSSSSVPQTPLFSCNTPKMLCFGDFNTSKITPKPPIFTSVNLNNNNDTTKPTFTKLNDTNNNNKLITHNSNNNKRRNGSGKESGNNGQKNGMMKKKKNKPEMGPIVTSSVGHAKAKREKLGERISVLQQLVCPYGKTDTASVLHEAMGYIRFLHDQVKVLSTPYLKRLPSSWSSLSPHQSIDNENGATAKDSTDGLRDMGLCLVPLEYILQVASSNGADFWPPTISSSGV